MAEYPLNALQGTHQMRPILNFTIWWRVPCKMLQPMLLPLGNEDDEFLNELNQVIKDLGLAEADYRNAPSE